MEDNKMKRTIIGIIVSNAVTLIVFYLMYRWGADNIQYVQQYYYIPLAIVLVNMIYGDVKELRVATELNK
jgi:hypothetical protein